MSEVLELGSLGTETLTHSRMDVDLILYSPGNSQNTNVAKIIMLCGNAVVQIDELC